MIKNNITLKKWQKYFKLDRQYFDALDAYALGKIKYSWFKKFMLGIFGGLFVGFGYTAYLFVAAINPDVNPFILSLIGALLFPVALLLCIYFGGSLFTSSCVGIVPVVCKECKTRHYISDLLLTLLGNGIGGLIFALIVWASNLFGGIGGTEVTESGKHIIELIKSKIDGQHQWWNNIFSGILCNFIVAGTTILSVVTKKNAISVFIIYLMLIVFVITGLQHVVANLYLFTIGGFVSLGHGVPADLIFTHEQAGQLFYQNLIPAFVGNFLGGAGLSLLFINVQSFIGIKKKADKTENESSRIEITNN